MKTLGIGEAFKLAILVPANFTTQFEHAISALGYANKFEWKQDKTAPKMNLFTINVNDVREAAFIFGIANKIF